MLDERSLSALKILLIGHSFGAVFDVFRGRMWGNKSFFIPKNYDEFLTKRYGNYMEFPPESEVYSCCESIVKCEL